MSTQIGDNSCAHKDVTLLNAWEPIRKYVCAGCGAVMTCACNEDIATLVLPHQGHRGVDPDTREDVPVTRPLAVGVCFDCRGETPPAAPRIPHRRASSVIHRYYWHELFTRSQRRFLDWASENGLPLFDSHGHPQVLELQRVHADQMKAIHAAVLEEVRAWHASDPRYDTSRPSDADILDGAGVSVTKLPARYITPSPSTKALVVPVGTSNSAEAVTVEDFAAEHYRREGREVMALESRPFQCLFGCLMWMWVADPADERGGPRYFGGRDGVGADVNGLIAFVMPEDFGSANHATRRADALRGHLDFLPEDTGELLWVYDYWLDHSRAFRQYLWAYTTEDESRARQVIEVLGAARIKDILMFLAANYWDRYLGWPDLLTWRTNLPAVDGELTQCSDLLFVEVKSSGDKLSEDQRRWITANHDLLQLPFELAKVHRAERLHL